MLVGIDAFSRNLSDERHFCRNVELLTKYYVLRQNTRFMVQLQKFQNKIEALTIKTVSGLVKLTKMGSLVAVLRGAFNESHDNMEVVCLHTLYRVAQNL